MENLTTGMQPAFLLLIFHSVGGMGAKNKLERKKVILK